jgi:hypothetical protein
VLFAPDTAVPEAGDPVVGKYETNTLPYVPEQASVVLLLVVLPSVMADDITPMVYFVPPLPPVTV